MRRRIFPLLAVLLLVGLAYWLLPKGGHSFYGTRLLNPKPVDFTLQGPSGPVRLGEMGGRLVLLFFGYVHCPDVCPTTLIALKRAYERLSPEEQARVRVVFVSVDPDRDTPEVSDRYAKGFHPSFLGLSGSLEAVQEVARTFGVYYQKTQYRGPGEYLVDHTATTFVVQDGKLVLLFSPEKVEATDKVVADLRALF
ncbi:SCO family protein [Thermus sp.]|uniref:SCO family protein n=1 Tax=Thermus sp. TaxID=275 RepID=UPI0025D67FD4|nr:SCO family protein [Thermus sp.]MCS6867974.1 SCO family protein [Thermus sp.]MCX7848701.1 SCO family protein [Thermus sp.]MDW8016939.1 SCO family protein [Thermus sp.]MDW8357066.1 SCO family protein [Thermus sp.]